MTSFVLLFRARLLIFLRFLFSYEAHAFDLTLYILYTVSFNLIFLASLTPRGKFKG